MRWVQFDGLSHIIQYFFFLSWITPIRFAIQPFSILYAITTSLDLMLKCAEYGILDFSARCIPCLALIFATLSHVNCIIPIISFLLGAPFVMFIKGDIDKKICNPSTKLLCS